MKNQKQTAEEKQRFKCDNKNCTNYTDEGKFIGVLCAPCYYKGKFKSDFIAGFEAGAKQEREKLLKAAQMRRTE